MSKFRGTPYRASTRLSLADWSDCMVTSSDFLICSPASLAPPFQAKGAVSRPAQQRQHPLRRAERAVAEVVVELAVGVAVGVATVAAHPAVVRQPGVVEQQLARVGRASARAAGRARSLRPRLAVGQSTTRDRIVERVGDVAPCGRRRAGDGRVGRRPTSIALHAEVPLLADGDFTDAGQCDHDRCRSAATATPAGSPPALPASPSGCMWAPVIEVALAGRARRRARAIEVVRHQEAPVDVVANRVGQLVEHLVGDEQHLLRQEAQPADVVRRHVAERFDLAGRRIDHRELSAERIGYDQALRLTEPTCSRGANGRSTSSISATGLGVDRQLTTDSRRDQSEATNARRPSREKRHAHRIGADG